MTNSDNTKEKHNVRFYEVQHFWQQPLSWIVWIICIGTVFWLGREDLIHQTFSIITLIILAGVLAISTLTNLTTEISGEGISYKMWPFHTKPRTISWEEIASAEVRKYKPIGEFGGWGVRVGTRGRAYNVKGNMGLQLVLVSGTRILIGTQKPEQLAEVLDNLKL